MARTLSLKSLSPIQDATKKGIIEMAGRNIPLLTISKKYSLEPDTIRDVLTERRARIISMNESGMTLFKIAEAEGTAQSVIRRILTKAREHGKPFFFLRTIECNVLRRALKPAPLTQESFTDFIKNTPGWRGKLLLSGCGSTTISKVAQLAKELGILSESNGAVSCLLNSVPPKREDERQDGIIALIEIGASLEEIACACGTSINRIAEIYKYADSGRH